jgi:pimeloyl-ACP methyl ester carboxylesterase
MVASMAERSFRSQSDEVEYDSTRLRINSLSSPGDPGDGAPVVFLPGLGASAATVEPTARLLDLPRDLYLVDLPGLGGSQKPAAALDVEGLADVVVAWSNALGLGRVALVGHSLGSEVAVDLAVRRPDLVERLALVSPTVDPAADTLAKQLARLALDGLREPPSLILLLARDYWRAGLGSLLDIGRAAVRDHIEERLPELLAPTLVVRGGRDPLVSAAWADEVCRLVPQARLVVIPRATHAVPYSAPAELAEALREFLEGEAG